MQRKTITRRGSHLHSQGDIKCRGRHAHSGKDIYMQRANFTYTRINSYAEGEDILMPKDTFKCRWRHSHVELLKDYFVIHIEAELRQQ